MAEHPPPPKHRHGHMAEADWQRLAAQTELEGETLIGFVTDTMGWVAELRGASTAPVRRVLDIGSGPGVGTCELARLFPDANVVAVDSSPAMLDHTIQRATAGGLQARISTHLAELPGGLDVLQPADVIWASMSLHHVGDEVAALRLLRDHLEPSGLLAIAEHAEAMRVVPDELDVGRPGLHHRLAAAAEAWFTAMREALPDAVPSTAPESMLAAAGFDVIVSRISHLRLDAPLSNDARRMVLGHLRRTRQQVDERLDQDDLHALDVLTDRDDPRCVMHRPDVFVAASRRILVARAA